MAKKSKPAYEISDKRYTVKTMEDGRKHIGLSFSVCPEGQPEFKQNFGCSVWVEEMSKTLRNAIEGIEAYLDAHAIEHWEKTCAQRAKDKAVKIKAEEATKKGQ